MKSQRRETRTISEQAAEWLGVLAEGGAAEQAAFLEWLKKSPRHVEEFLFVSATWKRLNENGARQPQSIDAILAEVLTPGAASNVVTLERDSAKPEAVVIPNAKHASRRGLSWAVGLAALILIAVVGWWVTIFNATYSTDVGEQRTVSLADGSVLYLNADSRARVRLSEHRREIQLLQGEALFVVAHDRKRPFLVRTNDAVVQAVGTQFNVRQLPKDTRVWVIEGRVKVARQASASSARATPGGVEFLTAGEQAIIAGSGEIAKAKSADISQAIAWRERRLVFKAETLQNVVTEVNRYSSRQFRIEGEHAKEMQLTATFDADQPEALARFLENYAGLKVEARGEEFVIREQ